VLYFTKWLQTNAVTLLSISEWFRLTVRMTIWITIGMSIRMTIRKTIRKTVRFRNIFIFSLCCYYCKRQTTSRSLLGLELCKLQLYSCFGSLAWRGAVDIEPGWCDESLSHHGDTVSDFSVCLIENRSAVKAGPLWLWSDLRLSVYLNMTSFNWSLDGPFRIRHAHMFYQVLFLENVYSLLSRF